MLLRRPLLERQAVTIGFAPLPTRKLRNLFWFPLFVFFWLNAIGCTVPSREIELYNDVLQLLPERLATEAHITGVKHISVPKVRRSQDLKAVARNLYREVEALPRLRRSSVALHTLALLDVVDGNFTAALTLLEKAAARSPQDLTICNDLAAIYIERGRLTDHFSDYAQSLEYSEYACDKNLIDACFNEYLALKRLNLFQRAGQAWNR